MGSFDDFMASVDIEAIGARINEICPPEIILMSSSPEDLSACMSQLYSKAVEAATQIMMINLRAYHDWLQTQLP